ncbi:MAG: DUF2490 domain-containing protein [Acidobacteriota bacterium]
MNARRLLRQSLLLAALLANGDEAFAQTGAAEPPRDDRQFWHETQFIAPLGKQTDLIVIGVVRIGREFSRPVDERIGAGVAFKLNKYLTLMPTYVYVDQQPFAGRRISEHRLVMNVTGKFKLGEFAFTDRNLIERRARHASRDFTVYRNRLQIDHPARIGGFQFKPFIADEVWYSTQQRAAGSQPGRQGWFRNRISAGIIKQFGDHFQAEFFYLRQHDGLSRPGQVHALGTLFRVYLK